MQPRDLPTITVLVGHLRIIQGMPIAALLIYRDTWRSFVAKYVNHQLNSNLSAHVHVMGALTLGKK